MVKLDLDIKRVDELFFDRFKYLNMIWHMNPINVEKERQAFFEGIRRNPLFVYRAPRINLDEIKETLEAVHIPKGELGDVFERLRRQYLLQCKAIVNVGFDGTVVRETTSKIYGVPNEGLVRYAEDILTRVPDKDFSRVVTSDVIKVSLKKMMDEIGLNDWSVVFSNKWLTRTKHTKKVCVCDHRLFSGYDVSRLAVHEVGVHATRYANGYLQPLKMFVYGFPDSLGTEEGLAVYLEEATGNSSPHQARDYAGRVLATNFLLNEYDFRDCFLGLLEYGICEDEAWNLSVRVYRGGGFVKDHLYLEGYVMVKKFVEGGGNLKDLFVGKVGLGDLQLIKDLKKKKMVNEPKYLPSFLK